MIGVFESGQDIHKATAAEINNVTADGVTSDMRYQAKALNFGVLRYVYSRIRRKCRRLAR